LVDAGKSNCFWQQLYKYYRGCNRYRGRNRFDNAGKQIRGMPDGPDFHQVSGATAENEQAEHPENPIERDVAAFAYQVNQGERDAVIRKRDYAIRDDVQPHDLRIPQIAGAVWQEIRRK
jgi:hypothetical protein